MKFASLAAASNNTLDGTPILVSRDLARAIHLAPEYPSLLFILQNWAAAEPALARMYDALNASEIGQKTEQASKLVVAFDASACLAPLPRSPQWLDGSAFLNHGRLMEKAFNSPPMPGFETIPLMYQGASDDFLGATHDALFTSESDGIDFEGEYGVVLDAVPMATSPAKALGYVRLLVQINDWSLRALGPHEMKTGFGFLQAKPSTSFAPVAITPDEIGNAWKDGRVHLNLRCELNGVLFGQANGREMHFGFGELIAHAARTRKLTAGTIIGSGTVSNVDRAAGSSCIAERRVIEMIDNGAASTQFMRFGDTIKMQAQAEANSLSPFGVIEQRVVRAPTQQ